jgi:hypothetical protein
MSDFASQKDPLLSQSPSTSTATAVAHNSSSLERKRSQSRSGHRNDSGPSSEGSSSSLNTAKATVRISSPNGRSEGNGKENDLAGSKYDEVGEEDEEDDDLVAIAGEESMLRSGDNEQGYTQLNGPMTSPGRAKADIMRQIMINLALIGSWCE